MRKYNDFRDMSVWQLGLELLAKIYELTKRFPESEKFGLISDMRRAVNSVCHNIAEGYGRFEAKDKSRFYKISRGSSYELVSQIMVSEKLSYLTNQEKEELISEDKKIIGELDSLINAVENRGA